MPPPSWPAGPAPPSAPRMVCTAPNRGSGLGDGPARHRLREVGPPGGLAEGVPEVLRLVRHVLAGEFHDAHRVAGYAVVGDDALADPQIPAAGDPQDGEVPAGRVPAALRGNCRAAPESFTRLGVIEDRVRGVDGVLGFAVPAFRCLPVFLDRGPGPGIRIHRIVPSGSLGSLAGSTRS